MWDLAGGLVGRVPRLYNGYIRRSCEQQALQCLRIRCEAYQMHQLQTKR